MTKPFEFHGVEAEKAEAMRRYKNHKSFRIIIRAGAVSLLFHLWFPTVAISLLAAGDWFYRTGAVSVTNRTVVFVLANLLVAFIFLLSRDRDEESTSVSSTEPDVYDQYTSSSAVIVTASDDSKKQIVAAVIAEVDEEVVVEAVTRDLKRTYRRTKSERKKENIRPVTEYRRTESANSAIERLNSEEFRWKVEAFILEKKRCLVQTEHTSSGLELVA